MKPISGGGMRTVAVAAVLVNVVLLVYISHAGGGFGGSPSYGFLADHLLDTGSYSLDGEHPSAYRPPAYVAVLALAKAVGGSHWVFVARLIQLVMSVLCTMLVFSIGRRASGRETVGFWAVALYLLHFPLHALHYQQGETVLFELFLFGFLAALFRHRRIAVAQAALLAIAIAGMHLTRPTGIVFVPIALVSIVLFGARGARIRSSLVCVVLFLAVIAPWQFWIYRAFDRVTLASSDTAGSNLYLGVSPAVQAIYPFDVNEAAFYLQGVLEKQGIDGTADEYGAQDYFLGESLRLIAADPGAYLKTMIVKAIALYSPVMTPIGTGIVRTEGDKLVVDDWRFEAGPGVISHFVIVMLLVPLGAFELTRLRGLPYDERKFKTVTLVVFGSITTVCLVFFAVSRFRMPFDGLLCIATAMFLDRGGKGGG